MSPKVQNDHSVSVREHLPRVPRGRVCMHCSHGSRSDPRSQCQTASAEEPIRQVQVSQLWGKQQSSAWKGCCVHRRAEIMSTVYTFSVQISLSSHWMISHTFILFYYPAFFFYYYNIVLIHDFLNETFGFVQRHFLFLPSCWLLRISCKVDLILLNHCCHETSKRIQADLKADWPRKAWPAHSALICLFKCQAGRTGNVKHSSEAGV